jgi:hypothetical protein
MGRRHAAAAPLPLLAGFGVFVAVLACLVAVSLARRHAPTFAPSPVERVRPAQWARAGDTLTLDATRADAWTYASLARGRALAPPDTAAWDVAVQRYRVRAAGEVTDLGAAPFERAGPGDAPAGAPRRELGRWYRYSFVTHLLEPSAHTYLVRGGDGQRWRVQVVSYYCPGVRAGCLTLRYAPDP